MARRKSGDLNFNYTPLCDETVVRWLVQNRNTVMSGIEYGMMNEDILLAYVDLDHLIDSVKLSSGERDTIQLVMKGFAVSDIVDLRGGQRQAYSVFYQRAVKKICKACVEQWGQFYGQRRAKGVCY